MEKYLVDNVPTPLLGIGIVLVFVGLALGGLVIVRHWLDRETVGPQTDVAGFLIAVVGVLYAVVLAFVVVIQWQQYADASRDATSEATAIGNLYRVAVALGPHGAPLRLAVSNYAHQLAYVEWPYVAKHREEDPRIDIARNAMWKAVNQLNSASAPEAGYFPRALDDVSSVSIGRHTRVGDSASKLPVALWIVLLAGGALTIGFCYFFSLKSFRAQAAMVSMLAILIGLCVFVILALDLPLSGDVAVQPTALQEEIDSFCTYNFTDPGLPGNCDAISRARTAAANP
jgi:hypothetical protein